MSERITRVRSGEAAKEGRTDWKHIRDMTDAEIEEAIRQDPDTFTLEEGEVPPFQGLIFQDSQGKWRWRLIGPDGEAIADSPRSYADRDEIDRAIRALREAIVAGEANKTKAA